MSSSLDTLGGHWLHYDRSGHPITYAEYGKLKWGSERDEYVRIGLDLIGDVTISTVWLGTDQGWLYGNRKKHKPVIFETMTFSERERWDSYLFDRYCTQEQAIIGHLFACAMIRGEGREICK